MFGGNLEIWRDSPLVHYPSAERKLCGAIVIFCNSTKNCSARLASLGEIPIIFWFKLVLILTASSSLLIILQRTPNSNHFKLGFRPGVLGPVIMPIACPRSSSSPADQPGTG